MKKILALSLVLMLAFVGISFAASTYKYNLYIEDQFGQPITSGVTVWVKTVNTNTNSSVWPADNTTTGTLTGEVTPGSDGKAEWFSTATSHDVIIHYRGKAYAYMSVTPSSDRRVQVQKFDAAIDLDTPTSGSAVASVSDLVLPLKGTFFRITGTTNIDRISETGHPAGKRVVLLFAGTSLGIGQATGKNINISGISGTLTVGAGTLLEVVFDGTNWNVLGIPAIPAT